MKRLLQQALRYPDEAIAAGALLVTVGSVGWGVVVTTDAHATDRTRAAWETASAKYVREHDELLAQAPGYRLLDVE